MTARHYIPSTPLPHWDNIYSYQRPVLPSQGGAPPTYAYGLYTNTPPSAILSRGKEAIINFYRFANPVLLYMSVEKQCKYAHCMHTSLFPSPISPMRSCHDKCMVPYGLRAGAPQIWIPHGPEEQQHKDTRNDHGTTPQCVDHAPHPPLFLTGVAVPEELLFGLAKVQNDEVFGPSKSPVGPNLQENDWGQRVKEELPEMSKGIFYWPDYPPSGTSGGMDSLKDVVTEDRLSSQSDRKEFLQYLKFMEGFKRNVASKSVGFLSALTDIRDKMTPCMSTVVPRWIDGAQKYFTEPIAHMAGSFIVPPLPRGDGGGAAFGLWTGIMPRNGRWTLRIQLEYHPTRFRDGTYQLSIWNCCDAHNHKNVPLDLLERINFPHWPTSSGDPNSHERQMSTRYANDHVHVFHPSKMNVGPEAVVEWSMRRIQQNFREVSMKNGTIKHLTDQTWSIQFTVNGIESSPQFITNVNTTGLSHPLDGLPTWAVFNGLETYYSKDPHRQSTTQRRDEKASPLTQHPERYPTGPFVNTIHTLTNGKGLPLDISTNVEPAIAGVHRVSSSDTFPPLTKPEVPNDKIYDSFKEEYYIRDVPITSIRDLNDIGFQFENSFMHEAAPHKKEKLSVAGSLYQQRKGHKLRTVMAFPHPSAPFNSSDTRTKDPVNIIEHCPSDCNQPREEYNELQKIKQKLLKEEEKMNLGVLSHTNEWFQQFEVANVQKQAEMAPSNISEQKKKLVNRILSNSLLDFGACPSTCKPINHLHQRIGVVAPDSYIYCSPNHPLRRAFPHPSHPQYLSCSCPRGTVYMDEPDKQVRRPPVSPPGDGIGGDAQDGEEVYYIPGKCTDTSSLKACAADCSHHGSCTRCNPLGIVNFPYSRHMELYVAYGQGLAEDPHDHNHRMVVHHPNVDLTRDGNQLQLNPTITANINWAGMNDWGTFYHLTTTSRVYDKLGDIHVDPKTGQARILCWRTPYFEGIPIPKPPTDFILSNSTSAKPGKKGNYYQTKESVDMLTAMRLATVQSERKDPTLVGNLDRVTWDLVNTQLTKYGLATSIRYAFPDPLQPDLRNTCECPEGFLLESAFEASQGRGRCVRVCPTGTYRDAKDGLCARYRDAPDGMYLVKESPQDQ
eukprot:Nk52_evm22s2426 gene=Nk52_evmTU22s2426